MFDPQPLPLERIATLEAELKHEREMRSQQISWLTSNANGSLKHLHDRVSRLESSLPEQGHSDRKALVKVAVGISLPLAVYLLTGSHTLALKAAAALTGH